MNDKRTALTVTPDRPSLPQLASLAAQSQMVPRAFQDHPADCAIAIEFGRELGLGPLQCFQSIAVIGGKPTLYGDGLLAVVLADSRCEGITETITGAGDDRAAICTARRRGWPEAVVRQFSVRDARQAKLWGRAGPWSSYPDRMLQMRARGFCLRDAFADVLSGASMAEEVADYVDGEVREIIEFPPPPEDDATTPEVPVQSTVPTTQLLAPADSGATGVRDADLCRPEQCDRIRELLKNLEVPPAAAKAAIARRGVDRLADLSDGQADELIRTLTERSLVKKDSF